MSKKHRRKHKKSSASRATAVPAKFWLLAGLTILAGTFAWYYFNDPERIAALLPKQWKPTQVASHQPVNPEPTLPPVREKPHFEFYNILPNTAVDISSEEKPATAAAPVTPPSNSTIAKAPTTQTPTAPSTTVAEKAPATTIAPPKPNTVLTQNTKVPVYAAIPVPNPAAAKPLSVTTAALNSKLGYIVQVGAFPRFADADRLKAKLTIDGFEVRVSPIDTPKGKWYRVQIGPYTTIASAQQQQARLQRAHYNSIVRKTA